MKSDKEKSKKKDKSPLIWTLKITIITFFLSMTMNVVTDEIVQRVNVVIALFVLVAVILIGIIFDIVGIAITSVSEAPFHSRSAKGLKWGKDAVTLIRSADKVSNFCNDVVGDIAGVISGGLAATIVAIIIKTYPAINAEILSLVLAGVVAALTVGGKALGKGFALSKGDFIISSVAKIVYASKKIIPKKNPNKKQRKEN